jgi:hypothetical protein
MEKKCESKCGDHKCELPLEHKGKHREQGASRTDAGAARVNAELKLQQRASGCWRVCPRRYRENNF